jgi:drug/metabolite transporter (DMT)-like permease
VTFFIAPVAYFRSVEMSGLILPSMMMATIPVFTLALFVAIYGHIPDLLAILGVPLAVLGAVLAAQGPHPPWTPTYEAKPGDDGLTTSVGSQSR